MATLAVRRFVRGSERVHRDVVTAYSARESNFFLSGVYAVRVHGLADESLAGVANLGTRPTVRGSYRLLEVHLFDFDEDIYGLHVRVEFVHKLRDEKKFDSLEALKAQIIRDENAARGLLGD